MKITVNGEDFALSGEGTIPRLLECIGADPDRVAVMVNGVVVTRERRPSFPLSEGNTVEVLTFAGGG
jgi:thiamine biosynthesis protein ThiS